MAEITENKSEKQTIAMTGYSIQMNIKNLETLLEHPLEGERLTIEERIRIKALIKDMKRSYDKFYARQPTGVRLTSTPYVPQMDISSINGKPDVP